MADMIDEASNIKCNDLVTGMNYAEPERADELLPI
jgi:hypothetical protein